MNVFRTVLNSQSKQAFQKSYETVSSSAYDNKIASNFFPKYVRYLSMGINHLHEFSPYLSAKLTLKMLSITLRRKLSKKDIQFYDQGLKETYKVSKHRFHTYTFGDSGPALLLLHGFCSNAARWRNYIQPLIESGYQVIAMDAPGHGTSPGYFMSVPTYIQCVKEVLRSRTQWDGVVAHSMGGVVSAVALGELDLVQPTKYVLLNSFNTADSMMSTSARKLGVNEEVIAGLRTRIEQNTGRPLEHYSLEQHLNNYDQQGLIIYDKDDIIVPKSEAQKNLTQLCQFMTLKTEGLGHNLFSKEVEKTVINFLAKRISHKAVGPFPCKWEKYL